MTAVTLEAGAGQVTIHWVRADTRCSWRSDCTIGSSSVFPGIEGESFIDDLTRILWCGSASSRSGLCRRVPVPLSVERHGFFVDPMTRPRAIPYSAACRLKYAWAISRQSQKHPAPRHLARLSTPLSLMSRKPLLTSRKKPTEVEVDPARRRSGMRRIASEDAKVLASDPDLRALFEAGSAEVWRKSVASFIVRECVALWGSARHGASIRRAAWQTRA